MQNNNAILNKMVNGEFFLNWTDAFEVGASVVGGKAWNLGRLNRYGFVVPQGVVIPVSMYQKFVAYNQLQKEIADIAHIVSLENIHSDRVKELIERLNQKLRYAEFPKDFYDALQSGLELNNFLNEPVAVRSSATFEDSAKASFAGIHESFLNVKGIENILDAIKACFASIWTTRAIAYRRKMGIEDRKVQPAVIVMQLIDADAAGVAFSCDPASGREDVCLVSANFGLGESVVNGSVDPDIYYVERATYRTLGENIGAKQVMTVALETGGTQEQAGGNAKRRVLDGEQQQRLSILVSRVFSALGDLEQHVDIEWALKDDQFYLLQSRPVTVLPRYTEDGIQDQADIWSNANFRDAVPMVIPYLQRDYMMRNLNQTILAPFKDIGYAVKPGLAVAKYIRGRAYFNTGLYQWLLYDSVGFKPKDLNLYMGGHQPDIALPAGSSYFGKHGPRRLLKLMKNIRLISRYQKHQDRFFTEVDEFVERFNNTNLRAYSDVEFLNFVEETENQFMGFTDKYMVLCGGIGPFGIAIKLLQPEFGDAAIGVVNALASGQGDLPSAEQGYQLLELAEQARRDNDAREFFSNPEFDAKQWPKLPDHSPFKKNFQHYLDKYGYRSTYEMDCSKPRWSEDPSYLLINIAKSIGTADVAGHKRRQQQAYESAEKQLKEKVGFVKRTWIMGLIEKAVKGSETREKAKSYTVKLSQLTRLIFLEAGRRLWQKGLISEREDVFYCSQAEVYAILKGYWDGAALPIIVMERKQSMVALSGEKAPDVIVAGEKVFSQAPSSTAGNLYKGIGVSAGVVEGRAEIINNPEEGCRLTPGDIMVAPSTDPAWTPLFIHAAGIVLETGGYTSHGSIVAREYGIPAVVNVPGVLQLIENGQTVVVNANNGTITLK